jgi:hypothetical protein
MRPQGNLFVNTRCLVNKLWGLIVTLRLLSWGKQRDVVESSPLGESQTLDGMHISLLHSKLQSRGTYKMGRTYNKHRRTCRPISVHF